MKRNELRELHDLIYFPRELLFSWDPNVSEETMNRRIVRWVRSGDLIRLKRGIYTTKYIFNRYREVPEFSEFTSSVIKYPSYVSAEYVLRKEDALAEVTFGVTAIAIKSANTYRNKLGTFVYREIKPELFIGYERKYFLEYDYWYATNPKALFDYLYYKSRALGTSFRGRNIVEELRLRLDFLDDAGSSELMSYAEKSKSRKLKAIIKNVIENASN